MYLMFFFSNIGAFLNTVQRVFWTVKWWHLNAVHSVYITSGIFIIYYRINILEDRNKNLPVIGKLDELILKEKLAVSFDNLYQNTVFKVKVFLVKSIYVIVWMVIKIWWKLKLGCLLGVINQMGWVLCDCIWIYLLYCIRLTGNFFLLMNQFSRGTWETLETMIF